MSVRQQVAVVGVGGERKRQDDERHLVGLVQVVKTGGVGPARLRRFGVAHQDPAGRTAVAAGQQARQTVEVCDPEPERAQKVTVARARSSPRSALCLRPVTARGYAMLKLAQRQRLFVVEAGKSRFQRRQCLRQEAERRMSVRAARTRETSPSPGTVLRWRRPASR